MPAPMPVIPPYPDASFFIILNAGSGHEETELQRHTIQDVMNASGRRFELIVVDQPDRLDAIARHTVEQARACGGIVVAAGGDGTINTVAARTVASGCPFGVLPQGTFNYFGRSHGIPEDLGAATRALLDAHVQPVQVGMVNQRIFLVNASIGLYPRLIEERELDKAQFGRSRMVAILSGLKTMLSTFKHLRITLEIDGKVHKLRTPMLFVGNNRLQLEQLGIEPLSVAIEEGRLAAIAPRPVGVFGMLGLLARGAVGRLGEADNLVAFGFREMTVRRRSLYRKGTIKVATDGEVCRLDTPLHFRVLEGQLLLLKPVAVQQSGEEAAFEQPLVALR